MADDIKKTTTHPDYQLMQPALRKVRDAVKGSFFVKRKGVEYLPHPSEIDQTSTSAIARYHTYIAAAEFDEVPGQTMRSMIGRMKIHMATIDLPPAIDYLKENADNDGTSMVGQMEQVVSDILQVKWHLLFAEFVNSAQDGQRLTPAQAEAMGMRAAIKSYSRESVVDWDFRRINNVLQLAYIKLHEKLYRLDYTTGSRKEYDEYLIAALDDNGYYYWWKETIGTNGSPEKTEPVYPTVNNGQRLKWIPVEIVSDIEPQPGKMPLELGFLSPIVDKVLARYVDSAAYAEARQGLPPTMTSSGWDKAAWELFPMMNNNRDYLIVGKGINNLPEGVTMDVIAPTLQLEHYISYREGNASDIRALGGEFAGDESAANKSATQAMNERSDKVSRMITIVNNLESAYRRMALYCGMYEGIYQQDEIEGNMESIGIKLNREFAKDVADVEAGRFIATELRMTGLYSDEHIIKLLISRGWSEEDAETMMARLDGAERSNI